MNYYGLEPAHLARKTNIFPLFTIKPSNKRHMYFLCLSVTSQCALHGEFPLKSATSYSGWPSVFFYTMDPFPNPQPQFPLSPSFSKGNH